MKRLFRNSVMMVLLLGAWSAAAHGQAPVLLFTDIITGANSGGEGGNGVYITLYGKNFGTSRGTSTVTVGGAAVAQYKIWGSGNATNADLDRVVIQIGPSNPSGNIVMTVNGQQSNALPFTVCSGHIYFVSKTGSDSSAGSFAAPWLTVDKAASTMAAGDTTYFRAGTWDTGANFGATLYCNGACTGAAGAYQNFVGYPGETAQIGGPNSTRTAIYYWGSTAMQYVAWAELVLRGGGEAFTCQNGTGSCNWMRFVGDDMRSLFNTSTAWDIEMAGTNIVLYGNDSGFNCQGDSGCSYDSRAYSFYIGGYGTQDTIDIGWNRLHDNPFGKGIQVYGHTATNTVSNLKIHDNAIYNNTMVGINLGGSDGGQQEFVKSADIYNNVFWNNNCCTSGTSHDEPGALQVGDFTPSTGVVHVYNNTFYGNNTGASYGGSIGQVYGGVHQITIDNNIFYETAASPCYIYFYSNYTGGTASWSLSNNLYFGKGTTIACNQTLTDSGKVTINPNLVSPSTNNFHLTSGSPAIGAGTASLTTVYDYNTLIRPSPPSIGAFEFSAGTTVAKPNPPTNLQVVVN